MPTSRRSFGTLSPLCVLLGLFLAFASIAQAANAVIGIDFGTEYITAALVKPGIPLDIVLTKDSRRKELSAVAFKPLRNAERGSFPERLYGSDAVSLSARFPGDVYPNLRAILGLKVDHSGLEEYSERYPALKISAEANKGTAQFTSGAFTNTEPWMVEEILAMELQSIRQNAESMAGKGSEIKSVVITFPPYFDAEEKRAIELAADLAGLKVLSLISDGLAVGLNYATSRTFPEVAMGGKPEVNLVFDMGAGSSKATVLRFQGKTTKNGRAGNKTVQEIEVLGSGWDRTLGGDALNSLIVNDMINKFAESKAAKKENVEAAAVKAHGRATAMLWKSAEKLRQVLSANTESSANFEGVYNDIDFRYKLTRSDFEKLAEAHVERVKPVIDMALTRAGLELSEVDSIILTGGATRTPFVQNKLRDLAGGDKIRSNVNADEAAVFGAGFKGASLSPSFRVKEIMAMEAAQYAVGMKWTNINLKAQKQRVFTPRSYLGQEKIVSFQNLEDFEAHFYQLVDEQGNGKFESERAVAKLQTGNLTATVEKLKEEHGCKSGDIVTKFGIRLSLLDGEVEISKAAVQCEIDDEKKGVVDGVKGLFGFGKKGDQDIFADDEIVSDAAEQESAEQESSSSTTSKSAKSTGTASANAPNPSNSTAEPEKPKKRLISISLAFKLEKDGYPSLPSEIVSQKKARLAAFDNSDRQRILREEALNQLEAYAYRVRDKLEDRDFIGVSKDEELTAIRVMAEEVMEWLYSEGENAKQDDFTAKKKALENLVRPLEQRMDEREQRPKQVELLENAMESLDSVIKTARKNIENNVVAVEAWSKSSSEASVAQASAETSPAPVAEETDDLEVLDEASGSETPVATTSVAPKPTYAVTEDDLKPAVALKKAVSLWLENNLEAQERLPPTAEPVLAVKELAEKANEVSKVAMELLMKGMKQEIPKPKKSSTKKTKTSKTAKAKTPKKSQAEKDAEEKSGSEIREAASSKTSPSVEEASAYSESSEPVGQETPIRDEL